MTEPNKTTEILEAVERICAMGSNVQFQVQREPVICGVVNSFLEYAPGPTAVISIVVTGIPIGAKA